MNLKALLKKIPVKRLVVKGLEALLGKLKKSSAGQSLISGSESIPNDQPLQLRDDWYGSASGRRVLPRRRTQRLE